MMDLETITKEVCVLCQTVAGYIREQAAKFTPSDVEEKGRQNLVTYVDKTSEEKLVKGLSAILPGSEFIAEEFEYPRSGKGLTWVIDPLDGTTNFVHGVPLYSISVALMKDNRVLSGVIYHIPVEESYYAWDGGGAFLNNGPIRVSARQELESSLLVTGFPYRHEGRLDDYLEIFKELILKCRGVRRLGSAAIDLAYVAAGRMEGFYEYGLNSWDVAAGSLIVREAGGKVSDFRGGENFLFGREMIATNGRMHVELQEIIGKYFR